jgi:hypothetical protein
VVCRALVLASTFSSVDTDALRKPNRFIFSTVMGKLNKNTGQMRDPPKDNLSSYLKKI